MASFNLLLTVALITMVGKNMAINKKCYASGKSSVRSPTGREALVVDGVFDGVYDYCLIANGGKVRFIDAETECASEITDGKLMTIENEKAFMDSWKLFNYVDWGFMWVDFPPNETYDCYEINPKTGVKQGTNNCGIDGPETNDFVCQYPFQYTCSYRTKVKINRDHYFDKLSNHCAADFRTIWQYSDADHFLSCSMPGDTTVLYDRYDLCECVEKNGWTEWDPWQSCSGVCGFTTRSRSPKQCSKTDKQTETKTCNTNVPCPHLTSSWKSTSITKSTSNGVNFSASTVKNTNPYNPKKSTKVKDKKPALIVFGIFISVGFTFLVVGSTVLCCVVRKQPKQARTFGVMSIAKNAPRSEESKKSSRSSKSQKPSLSIKLKTAQSKSRSTELKTSQSKSLSIKVKASRSKSSSSKKKN